MSPKLRAIGLLILCSGLLSPTASAVPSEGIQKLLSTPASAFDVFLFQLYVAANGPSYFGGPNMKEQLRVFDLSYDYDSNLLTMKFHIGPEHRLMRGFQSKDLEGKKEMLLRAAKEIAESLGLAPRGGGMPRFGLIQMLKIRNGWATKDFNEDEIKDEVARRTVFELVYAWEQKVIYVVRRDQSGHYAFSVDTKDEPK